MQQTTLKTSWQKSGKPHKMKVLMKHYGKRRVVLSVLSEPEVLIAVINGCT